MSFLVSIIIPTYNHEKYIESCIKSVLRQTYNNWEAIIIDDGSTDTTAKILKSFTDQRIKYIYQEHIGVYRLAETYNKALSLAKGELIAILEGDDYWPNDKLARQIPLFSEPQIILSYGDCLIVDENGNVIRKYRSRLTAPDKNIRENKPIGASLKMFFKPVSFIRAVTVCIRKNALIKIGGFIPSVHIPAVNLPTFCTLAMEGEFRYLPEPQGYWRQHPKNTTFVELLNIKTASFLLDFINKHQKRIAELKSNINISQIKNNLSHWENKFNLNREYGKAVGYLELGENYLARQCFIKYLKRHRKRSIYAIMSLIGIFSSYANVNIVYLIIYIRILINSILWRFDKD